MQKWGHMNVKEWCKRIFIVPSLDTLCWYAQIFGFWCLMHLKKIICCSLVFWWILSPHPASFTPIVSLSFFNHRSLLTFRHDKFPNNTIKLKRRKPGNVYKWRHIIYSFIQTLKGRRKILSKIRRCVTDGCVFGAVLRFGGGFSLLFFFCTFLRRHFIELSRRHLQETTTVSGIPEPPPHPLSVLIRPLHVYNTPPPPAAWHYTRYTYIYGCAWQTAFSTYCKRGNI